MSHDDREIFGASCMTKFTRKVLKKFFAYKNFIISYLHSILCFSHLSPCVIMLIFLLFLIMLTFLLPLLRVCVCLLSQSNDINHQCHQRLCYQNELQISIYLKHVYAFTMSFYGFFYHIYCHLYINLHTHTPRHSFLIIKPPSPILCQLR